MIKKYSIILALILLFWNSYSQTGIDQISQDYYKYKQAEKKHQTFEIEHSYDDVNQKFTFYLDDSSSSLLYIVLNQSSEFHGVTKEYFFKDQKLFFVYVKDSKENYFAEPVRKYWQTEYRYYIKDNQPIQILKKEIETEGQDNLDSLSTVTQNIVIEHHESTVEYEQQNAEHLQKVFTNFVEYGIYR